MPKKRRDRFSDEPTGAKHIPHRHRYHILTELEDLGADSVHMQQFLYPLTLRAKRIMATKPRERATT
jgi:hypothetical protein